MSQIILAAPLAGWLTSIRDVPDPVFSQEMMGAGLAIDPTEGSLCAPCPSEVILVAPTRHSVTLRTDEGAELLIHIGLETVALAGRGFEAHVKEGDRVATGDPLISFDLDLVGLEAKSLVTPIVLTNADEFRLLPEPAGRLVERGQKIASIAADPRAARSEAETTAGNQMEALVAFPHGLHARPAARIADLAKRAAGDITISARGKTASARSPIAIMALDVKNGERVSLTGDDAAALRSIAQLLEAGEEADRPQAGSAAARSLAKNEIAGVCALPGIVLGNAIHWQRQTREIPENGGGVDQERTALDRALTAVRAKLQSLGASASGVASGIAKAHIGLLDDVELNAAADMQIERGKSAARAWQLATAASADTLRQLGNPLLRERIADLDDLSNRVTAELLGNGDSARQELAGNTILIAEELLPSELMSLPRDRLVGLATAGGGATSHMALIAASFGIPTLVAMGPQISRIPEGSQVLLDATAGVLVIDPDKRAQARALIRGQGAGPVGECVTRDGERVTLLANLGNVGDVEPALAAGAEGCGLLRTEFLFLERSEAPSEEEQRAAYQAVADALGGRPLTIRTLDIGGDKAVPYIDFPPEQNPALGARGVRTVLFRPELIDEQLRAIGSVTGDLVKVMLPMVSSVAELRSIRAQMSDSGTEAKLGVMIETPAAALIADRLAAEADFLSIGSNDLAQYVLAMDRTNPLLAAAIDALHPAVLRLMAMTADAAQAAGKPVSVCGNLASEPVGALVLVGFGIRELSGVPAALPTVRRAIAQVSASDCRALAADALRLESALEVRALAAELLSSSGEGDAS
ncbi:MAG: phosphoenolpyruvate--protein phosphotransferase [Sphingomonas sp.]